MQFSLISQLRTCSTTNSLNKGHLFPGTAFRMAKPSFWAKIGKLAAFDDNGRCAPTGRIDAEKDTSCFGSGLSADNTLRDHWSALQTKVTFFRVCLARQLPNFLRCRGSRQFGSCGSIQPKNSGFLSWFAGGLNSSRA